MLRALPLLLLLAAYAAAGQEMEWRWAELPQGFQLDLTSGQVADAGGEQRLTWEDGLLACSGTLARWPSAQAGPAERVTREGAVPVGRRTDAGAVQRGSEWIFDIGDEGWGYLRVLSVKEEALSLEWSWAPASQAALERRPGSLRLRARGARIELDWQAEEGETYLVERRVVGDGSTFRPLARVRGERTLDQAPPEGLLEYRVRQLGRGPGLGTSRRTVYGAAAGDQPLEIVRGMTIDLLCGTSGAPSADLEVVHLTAQSISLRPLDGTLIHPFAQTGSMPWSLPAVEGARYVDAVRTLSTSAVVAVYLREQVYGRLRFAVREDGRVDLIILVAAEGGRVLPVPPEDARLGWQAGVLRADLDPPEPQVPFPETLRAVLELERGFRSGSWDELAVGEPGAREVVCPWKPAPGAPPIVRLRLLHRLADGTSSAPGAPRTLLLGDPSDADQVEALLDGAFDDLLHSDYDRRLAARGVIVALESAAAPRLEEALRSTDPELASAAREILVAAAAENGGHVELLLRARAIGEGLEVPAPAGLFDPDPARRAWALMRHGDTQDGRAWARILALADPNEGVAALALQVPATPLPRGMPLALVPLDQRSAPRQVVWKGLEGRWTPHETARAAREAIDWSRPQVAVALLEIAAEIEGPDGPPRRWSERPDLAARLELALGLLHFADGDQRLVRAARSLGRSPGARAAAGRALTEARLHGVGAEELAGRERLEVNSFHELRGVLASLEVGQRGYLDLVLVGSAWQADAGAGEGTGWLDINVPGLRLVGAEGVTLRCGLRVPSAVDVVLEELTIENPTGSALMVGGGTVTARGCRFLGVQSSIMVQGGVAELSACHCASLDEERVGWSLRLVGGGHVLAERCLFAAGTVAGTSGGQLVFDRCVFDAGARAALQGQRDDQMLLLDCLVRGENHGVMGGEDGLAVGVVWDTLLDPISNGTGLRVCPRDHARTSRSPAIAPSAMLSQPVRRPR